MRLEASACLVVGGASREVGVCEGVAAAAAHLIAFSRQGNWRSNDLIAGFAAGLGEPGAIARFLFS